MQQQELVEAKRSEQALSEEELTEQDLTEVTGGGLGTALKAGSKAVSKGVNWKSLGKSAFATVGLSALANRMSRPME